MLIVGAKNKPNGHWECLIPDVICDPASSVDGVNVKVFVFGFPLAKSLLSPPPYKRGRFRFSEITN